MYVYKRSCLVIITLALTLTNACRDNNDQNSSQDWTLDDPTSPIAKDMGPTPDMDMMVYYDMPSEPTPDMVMINQDMSTPPTPDMPDDMEVTDPPRICDVDNDRVNIQLTVPSTLADSLERGQGDIQDTICSSIADGKERQYFLHIEEEIIVDIWTTYKNGETDDFVPVITLVDGCAFDEDAILACSGNNHSYPNERNSSIQKRLSPGDYLIIVDERVGGGFTFGEGGDFVLHVKEANITDNGLCEDATPLDINQPGGYIIAPEDTRGSTGTPNTCFFDTNQIFYEVQVPPQHSLLVRADYGLNTNEAPYVRLGESCSAAPTPSQCNLGQGRADIVNDTDDEKTFILSLNNRRELQFSLTFETTPIADNSLCEQAISLTPGTSSTPQHWMEAGPREPICANTDQRRALYYSVEVPDQHNLYVYTQDANSATRVTTRSSCDDLTCQSAPYINRSGTTQEAIIHTYYDHSYEPGAFSILPQVVPLADNSACTESLTLRPDIMLNYQDIRQGSEPFNHCQLVMVDSQPTLYYRVALPIGGPRYRITATANDPSNHSISLQLLDSSITPEQCIFHRCKSSDDAYFRSSHIAQVEVDWSIGGGVDPATAIIAVSMTPGVDPAYGWFTIAMEEIEN